MSEMKVITLEQVKEILEKEQQTREELSHEQGLAVTHCQQFVEISADKANKLFKELKKMEQISDTNAAKIAEILPTHADDVRMIFAKERFTLSQKDIDTILEIVSKYVK